MPSDAPAPPTLPPPPPTGSQRPARYRVSLGSRVALVTIASAVFAVLIAGAVSFPLVRDAARQQSTENLNQLADATAAAIERRPSDAADLVPLRLSAVLRAQDIAVFYVAPGQALPNVLSRSDIRDLLDGRPVQGERDLSTGGVAFSARRLPSGGVVVLTQPATVTGQVAAKALSRFGLALLAGAAIAGLFGMLLARRLTRPLRRAANAAERLSLGDRQVQLELEGPREIAELADALNKLQFALAVSEGRQRDFLLSVSHELRTPLTAIRGYAEALADGVITTPEMARTGSIMQVEADRLDRLVADLLELARLDSVDVAISPTEVDFSALGAQACQVWADRCASEQLEFRHELPGQPLLGRTDALRVRQIIDNLCANALRLTPTGAVMVLAVRPAGEFYVDLEVRDGGPGLTAEDCQVAFEPGELYTRYRGIRKVGTGVGLALVGRLARRLGGQAYAGSAPEGGARFTVRIARSIDG